MKDQGLNTKASRDPRMRDQGLSTKAFRENLQLQSEVLVTGGAKIVPWPWGVLA